MKKHFTTLELLFYFYVSRRVRRNYRLDVAEWQPWADWLFTIGRPETRSVLYATKGMTRAEARQWELRRIMERRRATEEAA